MLLEEIVEEFGQQAGMRVGCLLSIHVANVAKRCLGHF